MVGKCLRAFNDLQATIMNELVLGLFDYEKPYKVHVDTLYYAIRVLIYNICLVGFKTWKFDDVDL